MKIDYRAPNFLILDFFTTKKDFDYFLSLRHFDYLNFHLFKCHVYLENKSCVPFIDILSSIFVSVEVNF